jgi:hypothetical protein
VGQLPPLVVADPWVLVAAAGALLVVVVVLVEVASSSPLVPLAACVDV